MSISPRLKFIRESVRDRGLHQVMSVQQAIQEGFVEFEGDNYIQEGVLIGMDGFGYELNEKGEYEKFPHYGRVIIDADVDIYAGTTVQRGSTQDTIIEQGTKISGHCTIGHNTTIGKHCLIGSYSIICGSAILGHHVRLGEYVRIAPGVKVGNNVKIRSYCNVTKEVPADTHVTEDWT